MPVIRVGVQAPQGSSGQVVDLDGPRASVSSIANVSGESIAFSVDGGSNWTTIAAGASAAGGMVEAGMLRLRKVASGGAYPANVDVDISVYGVADFAVAMPSSLFANLPAAEDNAGNVIRATDLGAAGALVISDGTDWVPVNGECMLLSTVIPFVMPPNGSMAANGALTLGKNLDFTYGAPVSGQGGCWMYFAAGQVHAGSAAGWWYTVMSTLAAGVVYNNRYTSGPTTPPAIPAGLVIAGPGAFTADAGTDRVGPTVTLPANAMGRFGRLRSRTVGSASATGAGSRFHKAFLGSYSFQVTTITTSNTYSSAIGEVGNTGYPQTQRGLSYNDGSGLIGNAAYTPSAGSIDTTAGTTVSIALRNSSGADWLVLHAGDICLIR